MIPGTTPPNQERGAHAHLPPPAQNSEASATALSAYERDVVRFLGQLGVDIEWADMPGVRGFMVTPLLEGGRTQLVVSTNHETAAAHRLEVYLHMAAHRFPRERTHPARPLRTYIQFTCLIDGQRLETCTSDDDPIAHAQAGDYAARIYWGLTQQPSHGVLPEQSRCAELARLLPGQHYRALRGLLALGVAREPLRKALTSIRTIYKKMPLALPDAVLQAPREILCLANVVHSVPQLR